MLSDVQNLLSNT